MYTNGAFGTAKCVLSLFQGVLIKLGSTLYKHMVFGAAIGRVIGGADLCLAEFGHTLQLLLQYLPQ